MKRTLLLLSVVLISLAGIGFLSYKQGQAPKPAPTTVSITEYKKLQTKYDTLQKVDDYKLKQVADQVIAKDQAIQARTAQRDTLCTTYKNFKPTPTPALCQ